MLITAEGPKSPIGYKCWEAFAQNLTRPDLSRPDHPASSGPCADCPLTVLLSDFDMGRHGKSVRQEQTDPATGRRYLRTDSLIPQEDGASLHLIHSTDVTDLSESHQLIAHDTVLIDLLTNLSLTFVSEDAFDHKVNRALTTTGRFLGVDRAYILKDYPEEYYYTRSNIWLNPDVPENDNLDANKFDYIVRYDANSADYVSFCSQVPVCFADVDGLPGAMYDRWKSFDIVSLMAIPLHAKGQVWGILSFDMCTAPRFWSNSDLRLGQAVGGILSAAIERSCLEDGLRSAQSTLQNMLDVMPDMVYWKDVNYIIRGCNRRYADYVLLSAEEVIGKTDFDLYPEEIAHEMRKGDAKAFESHGPVVRESQFFRGRDGQNRWLSAHSLPIFDDMGKAKMMLCVLRDISESKERDLERLRRDEALQSSIRAIEAAGRAKIEFVSRMSQEIWAPLHEIIDMSAQAAGSLAENGGQPFDPETAREHLRRINANAQQLTVIMQDVLMMNSLSSDSVDLRPCVFNLEGLLMRVSHAVSEWTSQKRQDFRVVIEDDIPPSFWGDEGYIERVLRNLFSNSSQFTPEGGALTLRVSLRSFSGNVADVLFSVEDTGVGIPEDKQGLLFHPAEPPDGGPPQTYTETGLGLSIGKRLVALMGGEMGMESELGHGSRFYFNLPLEVVSVETPAPPPLVTADGSAPNLLFVDESVDNCRHFEATARRLGCTAKSATNCVSAIRAIQAALLNNIPIDVVFIDLSMPRVDGLKTAARIRERFEDQPIVMTASASDRSALPDGAPFLQKPVFRSTLADCLREALKNAPSARPHAAVRHNAEFAGKTILIADDVEINRQMLAGMLEHTNIRIVFAENGKAALDAFRADPEKFDLILMDSHMPRMDGLEATRRIRKLDTPRGASVPVIAVTANVFPEDIQRILSSGINDHISKPVDDSKLLETIRRYLLPDANGSDSIEG
jgi:PAS domain S-box-containing protein